MEINYSVSFWSLLVSVLIIVIPIIWSLIKMYFNHNSLKDEVKEIKSDIYHHSKNVDTLKSTTEVKLSEMSTTLIQTKTLVELLVQNKIKQ